MDDWPGTTERRVGYHVRLPQPPQKHSFRERFSSPGEGAPSITSPTRKQRLRSGAFVADPRLPQCSFGNDGRRATSSGALPKISMLAGEFFPPPLGLPDPSGVVRLKHA